MGQQGDGCVAHHGQSGQRRIELIVYARCSGHYGPVLGKPARRRFHDGKVVAQFAAAAAGKKRYDGAVAQPVLAQEVLA